MSTNLHRKSTHYRNAQALLLCVFVTVFVLDRSARILPRAGTEIVGTTLCLLGLLLMVVSIVSLRAVIQVAPAPRAGGHLVTSGLYRWLRHPIYTGLLLLLIGVFLRKPTVPVALASVLVAGFFVAKTTFEERLLLERYPDYASYRARSWGLIPGLR